MITMLQTKISEKEKKRKNAPSELRNQGSGKSDVKE
jgi:hypothetical protein